MLIEFKNNTVIMINTINQKLYKIVTYKID